MSLISTIAETLVLPSLIPPSPAICEWQSMMPGITNCPDASMIFAPGGAVTFPASPTSVILPSFTTIEPFLIVPFATVITSGKSDSSSAATQ